MYNPCAITILATSTAKYSGENVKKPNVIAVDKKGKVAVFSREGLYYEYEFEAKTGAMKEISSVNMRELKLEPSNSGD